MVKTYDVTYNVQKLSYSNFFPKTAIRTEKFSSYAKLIYTSDP